MRKRLREPFGLRKVEGEMRPSYNSVRIVTARRVSMLSLIRTAIVIVALTGNCFSAIASPPAPQSKEAALPTGSISGRITVDGSPAANTAVILMQSERDPYTNQPVARSMTDAEGKFQLNHVPAGRFYIRPLAPAFVPEGSSIFNQQGRLITVANGEAIEGLTIGLQRGGVITGRVTDASGRPRIQERINLIRIDEAGRRQPFYFSNYPMSGTDDRGVYR